MTLWFYVKTSDDPKIVGNVVCAYNIFEDSHPKGEYTWVLEKGTGPEDYWEIRGKFEEIKDLSDIALVYKTGNTVVLGEVNDDLVDNFMDPLLEKYGFDNIKCVATHPKA
ncbi:MAG TPA: hypothetical protein VMD05_06490 [Candidatus Nanoarchaeia archaeon]|nr:hypothetical protein [Candidatus Nanoarchaeia archaeon]